MGWISLVPCFNGENISIYQFIEKVNILKELAKWDDKQTAMSVKLRLGGSASEYIRAFGPMYDTWGKLKEALTQKFGDRATRFELEKQLVFCMKREGENAADYLARLLLITNKLKECYSRENLSGLCSNPQFLQERVFQHFLGGLNKDIRRFVLIRSPDNLEKALKIAQLEEALWGSHPSLVSKNKRNTQEELNAIKVPPKSRCYACRRKVHLIANCPFTKQQ